MKLPPVLHHPWKYQLAMVRLLVGGGYLGLGVVHGWSYLGFWLVVGLVLWLMVGVGAVVWEQASKEKSSFWWLVTFFGLESIATHTVLWIGYGESFFWIVGCSLAISCWVLAGQIWRDFWPRIGYTILFTCSLAGPLLLSWFAFYGCVLKVSIPRDG